MVLKVSSLKWITKRLAGENQRGCLNEEKSGFSSVISGVLKGSVLTHRDSQKSS